MKTKTWFCGVAVALLLASCGGSSDGSGSGGAKLCRQVFSKLQGCDLIASGSADACTEAVLTDPAEVCQTQCFLKAKCQTIRGLLCGNFGDIDPNDPAVGCSLQCVGNQMECADGSGSYTESDRCDGFPDCDDLEDEMGCPTFTCDDGMDIVEGSVCDGFPDCVGGEDENDCSGGQTSGGGIPFTLSCN